MPAIVRTRGFDCEGAAISACENHKVEGTGRDSFSDNYHFLTLGYASTMFSGKLVMFFPFYSFREFEFKEGHFR